MAEREALDAGVSIAEFCERALTVAMMNPPCVCDYNGCRESPCFGNCGCVACQREAGE